MSKGNIFLGFGRGKLGDVVFSRTNGEQVARARNRSPRNPQTPLQLLQRVVLKTVSTAYSMLQDITNHSFQGYMEGTESQSRFATINVAVFRRALDAEINSGSAEDILSSSSSNYATKSSTLAQFDPFIVSEGTIGSTDVRYLSGLSSLILPLISATPTAATITYKDIVDGLGLTRGDQLTFLVLSVDDRSGEGIDAGVFNSFRYARVILEPSDGDMTSLFFQDGAINKPNARNEGSVNLLYVPAAGSVPAHISFNIDGIANAAGQQFSSAGAAVIVSRLSGGVWQRSSQSLVLRSYIVSEDGHLTYDHGTNYLGDAIASYMTGASSSLYLNQAENF